ncbi:glycosyltransferase family 2 protein [Rhodococcus sp. IEGM 1381]|uniref:glycosyltransferase family 2 protein n=1 Tax=Rhodococcus sp. IEGM 1381 TaxID=3047085 RepID=UPI0024B757F9|nr:glycosyltransferase family 2 protein [Rhodococcus sp. IEGM 1381]MDI9894235.1 glycosyltransferase family 2 protein [Rhodococcus sp. IEGM 1381]
MSVVIPTVGRACLVEAIGSVLQQSVPILEVIVVADTVDDLELSTSEQVRVLRCGPGLGAPGARQVGVDAARGDMIALLDDDDLWHPFKIEAQLLRLGSNPTEVSIASCACAVRREDGHEKLLPRSPIDPLQDIAQYLYTYSLHRSGPANGFVQTSSLLFPRHLALEVPLDEKRDAVHDESTWLLAVRSKYPHARIEQLADPYVVYRVGSNSLSNNAFTSVDRYIDWGRQYLRGASARTRGDYYLTSPVAAAVSAGSVAGLLRAVRAGFRHGSPGVWAVLYAVAKLGALMTRTARRP